VLGSGGGTFTAAMHPSFRSITSNRSSVEIDNNLVENAIRPTALGKKHWLFFGDAEAGERSAIIYSIIESCRRHRIEQYIYLHDVHGALRDAYERFCFESSSKFQPAISTVGNANDFCR
jgi:hypothetical protein